jgi:hypothetical protein
MLSILLFSTLLVSSLTVTPSRAVDYTKVGVKVGDWAYYNFSENITLAPAGTTNVNMSITNIQGSNVTARLVYYYANRSVSYTTGLEGNISSGQYNTSMPVLAFYLLVPNLTTNDSVYSGAPYKINSTGVMVSGGLARQYVYANITVGGNNQRGYYDQATGINDAFNASGPGFGGHYQFGWRLNSTSLWSPPSYKLGVKVGDSAHYSFNWNATGAAGLTNANLTITNIDRGNLTATFTMYNSTFSYKVTAWENFTSGQMSSGGFPAPFFLLAANLTEDDPIWPNSPAWINNTGTTVAGGIARVTNQLNITGTGTSFVHVHWDQATGIVVTFNASLTSQHLRWSLISTSLWSPPDYSKVGVKVGDWAYYSVRQDEGGVDTGMRNANSTVTSIDRGNVTLTIKQFYANGTVGSVTMWGNVTSGAGSTSFFDAFLIAANLGENDPLSPIAPIWINGTVSLTVFGESRACNYAIFDGAHFYWDQATGITTKINSTSSPGNYLRLNMTSTSLWSPAPTINQPSAISYTFGSTGHSITWIPSSNVPSDYKITKNGTTVASASWNGGSIVCNVDGLAVGTYFYACTVNDTIGRQAVSTVIVTVTAAPPPPGLPISLIVVIGGIAVVVVIVAALVLRRRRA